MAGRKRQVPLPVLHKLFQQYKSSIIDDRKKVVFPSDSIWRVLWKKTEINEKVSCKAIYNAALKWWENNKDSADKSAQESVESAEEIENILNDSVEIEPPNENDESFSSIDETVKSNGQKFSITLDYDVWETIQPVAKTYKRSESTHKSKIKTYYKLAPGLWTTVLVERIASHRIKNPCTWSFKGNKVYPNGEKYIKVNAHCTTCNAILVGEVSKVPKKGDPVKFNFVVYNFSEKKHAEDRKSVRLVGAKAAELFSSKKPASVLKRDMIIQSGAEMFESEKGRTTTEAAIRCGQYRQRQMKKLSESPLQAIEYLKVSKMFGPMIHLSGPNPFFVIYGSPNQFLLYSVYKKNCPYTKITCDSTGGIVHKIGENKILCFFFHTSMHFEIHTLKEKVIISH